MSSRYIYVDSFENNIDFLEYASGTTLREIREIKDQWKEIVEHRYPGHLSEKQLELRKLEPFIRTMDTKKFIECMKAGDLTAMRLFLILGFDPNTVYDNDCMLKYALMYDSGNFEKRSDILYNYGADVDFEDCNKSSLVLLMSCAGNVDAVEWLIQHHAKLNTNDIFARTALSEALITNLKIADLLLDSGAEDKNAFRYAVNNNSSEALDYMETLDDDKKEALGYDEEYVKTLH